MKRILTILASAVVALTVSSCVKDITTDANSQKGVARTIGANIEAMTRTSMDDFEAGETAQVVWSEGDVIGVITANGTIRKATLQAEYAGQVEGVFDVENAVEGETYIYGYYPYNTDVTCDGAGLLSIFPMNAKRKFIVPEETDPRLPDNGLTFATNQLPMSAKKNAKGTLTFKSICGIIELQLLGDEATGVDEETGDPKTTGTKFFNITIQSDSKFLSGYGTVDLTADEPAWVPYNYINYSNATVSAKQWASKVAYMQGADNHNSGLRFGSDAPTSLFFVVPYGTYDDLKVQAGSPSLAVTKVSTKSHEIKRNVIHTIKPFNVTDVDDIYGGGDVIDLSVNPTTGAIECAQTYMANAGVYPQKYKFTAKMVGNTKTFKTPSGITITDDTADNYNTTYVYTEDTEGVITNLRREGDIVYFTANKPGNAIVCVGASNLATINSWFIWVSDARDQVLPGGHVFLDRDLGATYSPKNLAEANAMSGDQRWRVAGCHFQWGHPMPRPSMSANSIPSDLTASSLISSYDQFTEQPWVIHPWVNDGYRIYRFNSSTDAANLHRTRIYYNHYPIVATGKTSYESEYYGIWFPSEIKQMNSEKGIYAEAGKIDYVYGENALWQAKKTQFDPCPPGYQVPSKQQMLDAFTNQGVHTDKQYYTTPAFCGQYMEYDGQLVFTPWSGHTQGSNSQTFNSIHTNYPRNGWWFYDDTYATGEELAAAVPNCQYGTTNGGWKYSTDGWASASVAGINCSKQMVEQRGGGSLWWSTNYGKAMSHVVPKMEAYRYFICLGTSVRCVRATSETMSEGLAPSFEVDTPTDF